LPLSRNNKYISDHLLKQLFGSTFPTILNNEKFLKKLAMLSIIGPLIKELNDPHITFKTLHHYSTNTVNATKVETRLFLKAYTKIRGLSLLNFTQ